MSAKLFVVTERTLHDVPANLRALADRIEAGDFGAVSNCSIAMLGSELHVFGYGIDGSGTSTACVLLAGAHKIINAIVTHGE